MNIERKWAGRWINAGSTMGTPVASILPAPYLRKTFICGKTPRQATIFLCGLGWHVLYVNNQKADDRVLAPNQTQYDKHASFIAYDVTKLLKKGKNAVTVLLGNGLFNCPEPKWSFDKAPWRDNPKMLCDIVVDNEVVAKSDSSWKVHNSPITFDGFRNGQHYDARLEVPGFADPDLDDSAWRSAALAMPPGGRIVQEEMPPCKVMQSYPCIGKRFVSCWETVYDFGTNLTGWCKLKIKGEAGAHIRLCYAETVDNVSGDINLQDIAAYVKEYSFQTDEYHLKGDPAGEVYEPVFTYHGFRYVRVWIMGKAEVVDITAQFVHTAFTAAGAFESSHELLNTLQSNTLQSYKSNHTGIPTDCPHREKNGWTGDASMAAETGIWNFDTQQAYTHFLQVLTDNQRPNGQLPGIAPSAGWGYNWGNGPVFDNLLFEYVWQLYRFYGNTELIEQYYDKFKLYLEYCESQSDNYLVAFGLGDWCHWDRSATTPTEVTSSGYYYQNTLRTAFFAELLNKPEDAKMYRELAENIKRSFVNKYANGDGSFADKAFTATAAALYFGLVTGSEAETSASYLVNQLRQAQHKAHFGIVGAKFVPRVLADHGYADDAFEVITQKEFPGWGWHVTLGATTLWESWLGRGSRNHIMFGDISAWMYQYLAGIKPQITTPGFKKFVLQPAFVQKLDWVKANYKSPYGVISSQWQRQDGKMICRFEIPSGSTADIILPGKTLRDATGTVKEILF